MSGAVAFAIAALAAMGRSEIIATPQLASHTDGFSATAGIRFKADGTYETIIGAATLSSGEWVNPAAAADEWEIRATLDSGPLPAGTFNTWLAMTTSRTWSLTRSSTGAFQSELTFEFRRVGGGAAEATVFGNTLEVEVL